MAWKKKRRYYGKDHLSYYSLSKKLRKEFKSNEAFEIMLNNLSLEELIGLKLELASKSAGGRLYGLQLWRSLKFIVEDAVLRYAYSAGRTRVEIARFIGMKDIEMFPLRVRYNPKSYFEKDNEEDNESVP